MKIFSNFDSERKNEAYKEMVEKYGEENVLMLNKSFLFLFVKVLFPIFWWFIAVFTLRLIIFINMGDNNTLKVIFTIFMLLLYRFILIISSVIKYYIDYIMDF